MTDDTADEAARAVDDAAGWEQAVIAGHFLALLLAVANGLGVGWPGLWWHALGSMWALTLGIGAARTVARRVPSLRGGIR